MSEAKDKKLGLRFPFWFKVCFSIVFIFVLGTCLGLYLGTKQEFQRFQQVAEGIHPLREDNASFAMIRPLLSCNLSSIKEFNNNKILQDKINSYINQSYNNQQAHKVSVFFTDFLGGDWLGINENDEYHPASLLKLAVMMAYFKEAEDNPLILEKQLAYNQTVVNENNFVEFASSSELKVNEKYSIDKLIEAMIVNSDNGAKNLLIDNMDQSAADNLQEIFKDIGLIQEYQLNGVETISVKSYSWLLRFLYNSTYLDREYSNKAMMYLSKSTYDDGINAGLPPKTTVAHKFGEYIPSAGDSNQDIELHDCGVVYLPNNPYELCLMTRGTNLDQLSSIIRDISGIVYKSISGKN